jgi:hypothetical protein
MIIKYTGDAPPEFDGVVMIDCWQPQDHETDKLIFFYKLADYIGFHQSQCKQIVNASMQCRIDYNDPTMINTLQSYSWNSIYDSNIKNTLNYHNTNILLNSVEQFSGEYQLFQGLRSQLKKQNNCHYIVNFDDFLIHWHRSGSNRAKNWLVVGQSWKNCVHNNDIGLVSFAKILDYYRMNFFVREEFILTDTNETLTELDFSNDTLNWMRYHGTTTYQLMPDQINIRS